MLSLHPPSLVPGNNLSHLHSLFLSLLLTVCTAALAPHASALSCVWKITDDAGHTLYLAGSVHALHTNDYPLPASYEEAYKASTSLAFETDANIKGQEWSQAMGMAAFYPMNGRLKDHIDPRTYAYLLRVLSNVHGSTAPEKRIEHLRPWALAFMLQSGGFQGVSPRSGVETYFIEKAKHDHKPMAGLVPFRAHIAVFDKMSDADNEAFLLLSFIHLSAGAKTFDQTVADWKRGDVAGIEKIEDEEFRDAPGLRRRILTDRNLAWIPKLEDYLHSGKTWMVLAGTAHMVGGDGVPTLLRAKGYHIEQL